MNREVPYRDGVAKGYGDSQLRQLSSQRMHQNAGMDDIHGRSDTFPADQENPYVTDQWDRRERRTPPSMSRSYPESTGQGGNVAAPIHHGQIADPKLDLEHLQNKKPRFESHEEDMEIGYEDKPTQLTFEVLEQKFQNEILKLLKEQSDAEDAEIIRHKEIIIEINNRCQEQLAVLRARQASRREEFLRNESEGRLQKYKQVVRENRLHRTGIDDLHEFAMPDQRRYASGQIDHNREEPPPYHGSGRNQGTEGRYSSGQTNHNDEEPPPYHGSGRNQETEGRVPYPVGRVYNNARSRYS